MSDQHAVASSFPSALSESLPASPAEAAVEPVLATPAGLALPTPFCPPKRRPRNHLVRPHEVDKDSPFLVFLGGSHRLKLLFRCGSRQRTLYVCLQTPNKPIAIRRAREVIAYYARPDAPYCEFVWIPQTPVQRELVPPLREIGPRRRHLIGALGLEGWDALEPVLLASLASEEPLLVVGPHGAAKSLLVERVASLLQLDVRNYNASVLHFDDLVGVPLPEPGAQRLRYVGTASAVWGAEMVFFDELNRTRPELQNKVFPIVHERRVQGESLTRLKHRWAAMNRPSSGPGDVDYLGTEPLDPALADRFSFLVSAPGWRELTEDQQRRLLIGGSTVDSSVCDVPALVAEARRLFLELSAAPLARLGQYFVDLEELRRRGRLPGLSARRLRTLLRNTVAIQASRIALAALDGLPPRSVDWSESVWIALSNGLPQLAEDGKIDLVGLRKLHLQAWASSGCDRDDPWQTILRIQDPVERFVMACALGPALDDRAQTQVVLQGLSALKSESMRNTYAVVAFLALQHRSGLPAVAFETLAKRARPFLQPGAGPQPPKRLSRMDWANIERLIEHEFRSPTWGPYAARIVAACEFEYAAFSVAESIARDVCLLFDKLWRRVGLAPIVERQAPSVGGSHSRGGAA